MEIMYFKNIYLFSDMMYLKIKVFNILFIVLLRWGMGLCDF